MNTINKSVKSFKAFAPATCANVAVGFDILGFAFEAIGDYVTLTKREDQQIIIESIDSVETLSFATRENTASIVVQKFCQELNLDCGFSLHIKKGIPLSSGMGGSAASAVAALVACNAFLTHPLSKDELAPFALYGEQIASGEAHADNIIPCLYGGLTLIQSQNPIKVIQLPVPDLYCVLVHPHLHVATREARAALKKEMALVDYVRQSAYLASFITALYERDYLLLKEAMNDVLIEAQRAQFVPEFYTIKKEAYKAGALGMSFSGSGPSMFAFTHTEEEANRVCSAMKLTLKKQDINSDSWITRISNKAAHLV